MEAEMPLPVERHLHWQDISSSIAESVRTRGEARLQFVCTHNSRRSQFAQAWAHALAQDIRLPIRSWSAGTEATACNGRTVDALLRAGFTQLNAGSGDNPRIVLAWGDGQPLTLHSKRYDDPEGPSGDFIALMTCSEADENCSFIPGAWRRFPFRYEDPKAFDGTPEESRAYDRTCAIIREDICRLFAEAARQFG
jgi:arsenate reductase